MSDIQSTIEAAFERRADITPRNVDTHVKEATLEAIDMLDRGVARVAEKKDGNWVVNDWLKKAVLLSFRIEDNAFIKGGFTNYYDKVTSKYADTNSREFREGGVRVVPPATARKGSYIASGAVLMPSYVNIGAYVDSGTMSTPGQPWVPVHRSARTFTCPAVSASAACWNRYRPARPSSRTTASSARAPRSSRV